MSRVFVFGSNQNGWHGAGAAKSALEKHGAVYGQAHGLQGRSYAIPTKGKRMETLTLPVILVYVDLFLEFAASNPDLEFDVTRIGCGLAGYTDEQIAPMFADAPLNCRFPQVWEPFVGKDKNYNDFF